MTQLVNLSRVPVRVGRSSPRSHVADAAARPGHPQEEMRVLRLDTEPRDFAVDRGAGSLVL